MTHTHIDGIYLPRSPSTLFLSVVVFLWRKWSILQHFTTFTWSSVSSCKTGGAFLTTFTNDSPQNQFSDKLTCWSRFRAASAWECLRTILLFFTHRATLLHHHTSLPFEPPFSLPWISVTKDTNHSVLILVLSFLVMNRCFLSYLFSVNEVLDLINAQQ